MHAESLLIFFVGDLLAEVGPAAAQVYEMTPGRAGALVAGLLSLSGVIIGGLALARPAGRFGIRAGRRGATWALVTGGTGLALGALLVATARGGIGTGNGLGGALVAVLLGLIATVLGGLALHRSRRIT